MSKKLDDLILAYDNGLICYGAGCVSAGKRNEDSCNIESD